jgi:hypothetical protein
MNENDTPVTIDDLVLFNLSHKKAASVINRWYDEVVVKSGSSVSSCLHGRDVAKLVDIIHSEFNTDKDDDGDDEGEEEVRSSSMIQYLVQTPNGFIENESQTPVIKTVPTGGTNDIVIVGANSNTKASNLIANMQRNRELLQTTADSVCYRYYPKCELV